MFLHDYKLPSRIFGHSFNFVLYVAQSSCMMKVHNWGAIPLVMDQSNKFCLPCDLPSVCSSVLPYLHCKYIHMYVLVCIGTD